MLQLQVDWRNNRGWARGGSGGESDSSRGRSVESETVTAVWASEMMLIAARDLRSADGVNTIEVDGHGGSAAIGSARAGCGRGLG